MQFGFDQLGLVNPQNIRSQHLVLFHSAFNDILAIHLCFSHAHCVEKLEVVVKERAHNQRTQILVKVRQKILHPKVAKVVLNNLHCFARLRLHVQAINHAAQLNNVIILRGIQLVLDRLGSLRHALFVVVQRLISSNALSNRCECLLDSASPISPSCAVFLRSLPIAVQHWQQAIRMNDHCMRTQHRFPPRNLLSCWVAHCVNIKVLSARQPFSILAILVAIAIAVAVALLHFAFIHRAH
mmetsp:Transcript_75457/g.120006  ORF Transcript_75457/g.120006 Transcript_75457/m.120006 type:complete len:240 (-) Transcript_75457:504-1223(-)